MWIKVFVIVTVLIALILTILDCIVMPWAYTIPGYQDLKQTQQCQSDKGSNVKCDKREYLDDILLEVIVG